MCSNDEIHRYWLARAIAQSSFLDYAQNNTELAEAAKSGAS